jgi:hypothetical protein
MPGIKDLQLLLESMQPVLDDTEYVFCTFPEGKYGQFKHLRPIGSFSEKEGLTLIFPRNQADNFGLAYSTVLKMITLNVHSSLEAVGLTAAVANYLAEKGISANVVAAYFHDHIFVPAASAGLAIEALEQLAARYKR